MNSTKSDKLPQHIANSSPTVIQYTLLFNNWGAVQIVSGILAEIFMVLGYFLYEALILGYGLGAAGAIIGNIGQGMVGIIVGCIVAPILRKSPEVSELMNRI